MYDGLAEFYDLFMQDVDYKSWCDFVVKYLPKNGNGVDVGCGSGAFTFELAKRGFDVFGVDVSPEMVNIAQKNARKEALKVDFAVKNADELKLTTKVDFITAICDVVNYIKKPIDFFKNTYNNLKDGGVFVFDVSSEYKLKKILGDNVYTEERDNVLYVWSNSLYKNRVEMFLSFFRRDADGRYTRFDEEQTQYIHNEEDLAMLLFEAGFDSVQTFSESYQTVEKDSERIHFIAKKGKINGEIS
ncbi:MAG: class I SAM-dependent methyltransferase [Clostridia bacterium]|nr:class I SAM-dependent methyltransferase [Clostridia bacterium]